MKTLLILLYFGFALSTYDPIVGKEYYYYANVVFCEDQIITQWSCGFPCSNTTGMTDVRIIYNEKNNIKGYAGYQPNGDKVIVAFRGTQDIKNWIVDGQFFMKRYDLCEKCTIHIGFVNALHSVKDQLIGHLTELKSRYPTSGLFFTGHSLGAALTTIAALEMNQLGFKIDALYTYGCPRVGNLHFAKFVHQSLGTTYRHVYNDDLYVHLPPAAFYYKQYSTEIWQHKDGTYEVCSESDGEDATCSNSISSLQLTHKDHMWYFGIPCTCDGI